MKFKTRVFLRNFAVLVLLAVVVGTALTFFTISQEVKAGIKDVEGQLNFISTALKEQLIRGEQGDLQLMLSHLTDAHRKIAYAYVYRSGTVEFHTFRNGFPEFLLNFNRSRINFSGFQELESPEGNTFYDISRPLGDGKGSLHMGLDQSAVYRAIYSHILIIILLGALLMLSGGVVIYGIARLTDAEAHRAEKALLESEEKYRTLTDQLPVGIYRTSENGRIIHANPALAAMLGFKSVEELLNVPVQNTFVDQQERDKYLRRWKRSKGVLTIENKLVTQNGNEIWVRDTGRAVQNGTGSILYFDGIIEDITEQKMAEALKSQLEERLRQAQKMEAIGNLAGGIAHDFNNILGVIMGYSEIIGDSLEDTSPHKSNMAKVLTACRRAQEMIQQILAFSRKSEKERRPVPLDKVILESLKLLRPALPATIEIRDRLPKNSEPVLGDWTELHQVIMNLCTNAAHAMKDGGGILELSLEEIDLDPTVINRKDLRPGRYQMLSVSDNGHGMSAGVVRRIFEPYFTTKKDTEGTGMGLAVVHGIVKSHGGEITVYSEPSMGTTFHIYLPVTDIQGNVQTEVSGPVEEGSEYILFVDDEEGLMELGTQMLEGLGYQVAGKTSSVEALELFRDSPKQFSVVITDQTMPNMTGLQLSTELRRLRPDIPIILCTGFSESINQDNFKSHGINAFVMKPILRRKIASIIRKVLD